jgi:NAD(P)-dependent dehydrogenase (short-subunit alcohol dehydrogenase family)
MTVVVITGATAGIGRATAREFARRGASVALLARDRERLEVTRRELERLGSHAVAIPTDVADEAQVEAAAERVERELGPIDIWVNNAMATVLSPLQEIAPADFRRVNEVTYLGTVWGTMAALQRMRARNRGTIVQVGSALAYRSIPLQSPYCGAKHAVRGFTESVRCELLHERSRVHITTVEMPGVNTPQFSWCKTSLDVHPKPLGSVYQPEVAARAIVWAASQRRREVNVTAIVTAAIWADKLVPGLLDRYMARTAVKGQQSSEPIRSDRPSNLWQPVPGAFGAQGRFGERAKRRSASLWLNMHRPWVAAAALGLVGIAWKWGGRARRRT